MQVTPLAIPDVLLIEPRVFGDERGFFYESWNRRAFAEAGIDVRLIGGADVAAELDAKRAIKQGTEVAAAL